MSALDAIYAAPRLMPTSLSFLLILLPVMLAVYYLLPVKARAGGLFFMSLGCYFLAEGGDRLLLLLGVIVTDYAAVRLLGVLEGRPRLRLPLAAASVAKSAGLLVWFGIQAQREGAPPVLGLQIAALASMGAVLLTYQKKLPARQDILRFGACCVFFPALYAGPLAAYGQLEREAGEARLNPRRAFTGLGQTVAGAFKTAVIGGGMYALCRQILDMDEAATTLSAWSLILTAALALYYGLSGLADMAKGIGLAFGLTLPQSFYYPYQSRSVADFFERMNSTVYRFLDDFARVLPKRLGAAGDCANTLIVGALWGLWFGFAARYLLWGVFFALCVLAERYVLHDILWRIPLLFRRIGTLFVVLAGFTLFVGGTLDAALALGGRMLHFYAPASDQILYLLSANWLVLAVACFFATNAASLLLAQLRKAAPRLAAVITAAIDCALFVVLAALS